MRLPHYLSRCSSGLFCFRLCVPRDLRGSFGLKVIKRSLRTHDPRTARVWADALAFSYSCVFAEIRGKSMARFPPPPSIAEIVARVDGGKKQDYKIKSPSGWEIEVVDEADHARVKDLFKSSPPSLFAAPPAPAPVAPVSAPEPQSMTLAQAIAAFAAAEAKAVAPDTWDARQRAFKTFSDFWGANTPVHKITRIKSAEWANALTARGKPAAKSYRANMVSHVAQVFAWLRKQGQPLTEDNPVKGLVVMTAAEKERRLNEGYTREAFEESDLPRIFSPKSLRRMRHQHGRWGALICLYTGARVGEVAQLFLRDFSVEDGLPCFRVCSESDGQTIKTPTSKRLVPIHPDLLRLGLMERVERLRAAGAKRFFPDMSIESKAGTGNAIGKSFSYLIKKLEIFPRREHGTLGIHGLRKNVIQALQASRMDSERRRALVGHDTEFDGVLTPDVHQRIYMRQWKATELSDYFTGIRWGEWIDFDGLRPLLNDAGK